MSLYAKRLFAGIAIAAFATAGAASASAERLKALGDLTFIPVLIEIDSDAPTPLARLQKIAGVAAGERLVGLDYRPATGELYAIGATENTAQLYTLDDDGPQIQATAVGAVFEGLVNPAGTTFGLDFNPMVDRLRLISSADQNLVFNPDDGVVTVATDVFYIDGDDNAGADPAVAQIAYDQNVDGTPASQQRGIDTDLDILVTVNNSAGDLATIGGLGVDALSVGGFDVSASGEAFAALITADGQRLYSIDLASGAATDVGLPALGFFAIYGLTTVPDDF